MEGDIRNVSSRSLSSMSSLSLPRPEASHGDDRRRLLLIYIHGFMGSEASFHDLPVHVHDLLTNILCESHVVYTRIYPRYKSHGELRTAVEQFSNWYVSLSALIEDTLTEYHRLSPHEADDLDVILLGHSLGGILAADVALLQENEQPKHRILGLVNFDVPFLGLHPRIIPTGIMSSMPKKDLPTEDQLAGEEVSLGLDPTYKPVTPHPNFDPPFRNDVRLAERGFLKGMMHFVNKNTDNLSRSIFDRLVSPVKFANCVNNYSELRRRHRRLMELEAAEFSPGRVRFVNYYTTSTGRASKKAKVVSAKDETIEQIEHSTTTSARELSAAPSVLSSDAPSIFSEAETVTSTMSSVTLEEPVSRSISDLGLVVGETIPDSEEKEHLPMLQGDNTEKSRSSLDLSSNTSTTSVDQPKSQHSPETTSTSDPSQPTEPHKRKLRKFILLPSDHWKREENSHWTPILMEDMDEVTAHQSMFIPRGANYDHLVGDTVAMIEQWVQSDSSRRLLQECLD